MDDSTKIEALNRHDMHIRMSILETGPTKLAACTVSMVDLDPLLLDPYPLTQ